jgi:Zn-dependent protease
MADVPPEPLPAQEPPAEAAPVEADSPGNENEDLYLATSTLLVEPETTASAWRGIGCLLLSGVLFVLSFLISLDFRALGFIIPVLFLHEMGHFLGMRAFSYRNVQMFFIPFFGAAVSGKKHAAPAWQQAVVLLLGPLPGILLGLALQLWLHPVRGTWPADLVLWLVMVNGFNLLPVIPFDGGRLLEVLLFSRRPVLALVFQIVAVLALIGLAVEFESWVLGGIGALLLLAAPARYRKAKLERAFRNNPLELPDRLEELSDSQRRDLFGWALLLHPLDRSPVSLANDMRAMHEHMVSRPVGWVVCMVFLGLYLSGIAGASAAGLLAYQHNQKHVQQEKIIALVNRFDKAVDEMHDLDRRHKRLRDPKGRDRLEAKQLQGRVNRVWGELIAEWKKAPPEIQQEAKKRVLKQLDPKQPGRRGAALRLVRDLGLSQTER